MTQQKNYQRIKIFAHAFVSLQAAVQRSIASTPRSHTHNVSIAGPIDQLGHSATPLNRLTQTKNTHDPVSVGLDDYVHY